jgi:hypothetical protein
MMGRVDPDDDAIRRWVVKHYRYDPERRERRHVVVAAFDNPDEYHADIEERAALLRARRVRGEDVDPAEHITGQAYEPGYRQRQRNAHLLRRGPWNMGSCLHASRTWSCRPTWDLSALDEFCDGLPPKLAAAQQVRLVRLFKQGEPACCVPRAAVVSGNEVGTVVRDMVTGSGRGGRADSEHTHESVSMSLNRVSPAQPGVRSSQA